MPIPPRKLALLFGLLACSHGSGDKRDGSADTRPPGFDGQGGQIIDVAGPDLAVQKTVEDGGTGGDGGAITCTDKITFSQETGCRNDNAVEFCIPDDATAVSQVKAIAPTLECSRGAGGRAECQPETQQLCRLPIPREQCPWAESMPDALWFSVCRLSALDAVGKIVPTYYE